ncbi:MAG: cysteine--tRNA ligase, partial [Thermoproteota archaeon]
MKVYNTLGKSLQDFVPLEDKKVKMYSCGPTVYGLPHIGNYRSFFTADIMHRYLEYRGYDVTWVMNITDIDDKTIRDSAAAGMGLKEFTEKYTQVFLDGLDSLHILHPDILPKATEHIPEMIALVQKLVDKGIAYQVGGSIYYSIRKFPDYGKLSQVDLEGLEAGHRVDVDEYGKDEPNDFVLWKASTQEEISRGITFDSPWGRGRPGWHIECSAMSTKYLGQPFDIHTGGIDLVFPHHENEIAQSEGAHGKDMAKYWLHCAHLIVDGRKMSKSKGNWFTLTGLLKKYDADSIRYFFLETHYR